MPVCLTVTLLDGLVLARSVFEMSVNYRSVVVLGEARRGHRPDEKLRALEAFTEQVLPGRWAAVRGPTPQELKATSILVLPLDEASAKVSEGGPDDGESADAALPVWAGISRCTRPGRARRLPAPAAGHPGAAGDRRLPAPGRLSAGRTSRPDTPVPPAIAARARTAAGVAVRARRAGSIARPVRRPVRAVRVAPLG